MSRYRRLFTNLFPSRLPASRFAAQFAIHYTGSHEAVVNFARHVQASVVTDRANCHLHDIKTVLRVVWLQVSLVQT